MADMTFQIMKVKDETPFYQLGNLPTFRLQCELFEYSDEDFDTGVPEIDDIETFNAYQWRLTLDSASNGWGKGEIAYSEDSDRRLEGEVVEYLSDELQVYLAHVGADEDGRFYRFNLGELLLGTLNGSVATITEIYEMQNLQPGAPGGASRHVDSWDLSALEFIDFSETNPLTDIC